MHACRSTLEDPTGSALCRTVLPAVGLAVASFIFGWAFTLLLATMSPALLLPCRAFLDVGALAASLVIFCMPESEAPGGGVSLPRGETSSVERTSAIRSLLWLVWRQGLGTLRVLVVLSVAGGFIMVPSLLQVWPVLTLLIGVLCGLAVWRDEQAAGQSRYLGDQRLPLARIWLFKLVFWLGMALAATALSAGCGMFSTWLSFQYTGIDLRYEGSPFLLGYFRLITSPLLFAFMWVAYGFAMAQLAVLIWRKTVVTFVLSLAGSIGLAGIWIPSLALGGLPWWQVMVLPLAWIVTAGLILWPWASTGVQTLRPIVLLTISGTICTTWVVLCLCWRAWEVPTADETYDPRSFEATLPTPEQNLAARRLRTALIEMQRHRNDVGDLGLPRPPAPEPIGPIIQLGGSRGQGGLGADPNLRSPEAIFAETVAMVRERGWASAPSTLGPWLDRLFEGAWPGLVAQTLPLPPRDFDLVGAAIGLGPLTITENVRSIAVVDDPRTPPNDNLYEELARCQLAAQLYTLRAVQLLGRGQPESAVEHLATPLSISRLLRRKSAAHSFEEGVAAERLALGCLEAMMPELLQSETATRRMLRLLDEHEQATAPLNDVIDAEMLALWTRLTGANFLVSDPGLGRRDSLTTYGQVLTLSLQTPWERTRAERLYQASYREVKQAMDGMARPGQRDPLVWSSWLRVLPGQRLGTLPILPFRRPRDYTDVVRAANWQETRMAYQMGMCRVRGLRLQLALGLYEKEHGRPAARLQDLVPGLIAAVPIDPFTGGLFDYRVAQADEVLAPIIGPGPPPISLMVAAGQGVVWSAGPDRRDSGGVVQGRLRSGQRAIGVPNADWVFLVPKPVRGR